MAHNIVVIIIIVIIIVGSPNVLLRRKVVFSFSFFSYLPSKMLQQVFQGEARSRWNTGGSTMNPGPSLSLWNQGTVGKGDNKKHNGTRVGQLKNLSTK
ncbi:hypothetical protein ASPBRDRAFT_239533 [Aspergillus brasiliensis CBS 101740]|uniref:Uncharacterized protein n=1 Tax=Aspergillus brasiliensis (strain CBS 101740 / IMI 381727 / IBT 21946) TaxID=767769 RepID=A0A1L9V0S6_ASPBC|nr:hypothetical protein ASPBRDRAFT_239533 [Aspergillus brasiliensis CBS 101740]